jgi:hypothetical protein
MSDNKGQEVREALIKLANSASVVSGATLITCASDLAFDIETAPARADLDDSSLLDAETARVASIGYYIPSKGKCFISYDPLEEAMLRQFWETYMSANQHGSTMFGFNCFGFDLPFLVRRSWFHGICVPKSAASSGRYWSWSSTFVDLMAAWRCGSYKDYISLDKLSRFLGVGEKCGSGELFYKLWEKDRPEAIKYLVNDVKLTYGCAVKMGMTTKVA